MCSSRRRTTGLLAGLLLALVIAGAIVGASMERGDRDRSPVRRRVTPDGAPMVAPVVRGVTLAPIEDARLGDVGYGSAASAQALDELARLGATWVSLTPFGRVDDLDSTEIVPDFEWSLARNQAAVAKSIDDAHRRGLRVIVIPHVWVSSGRWRGAIAPAGPTPTEGWQRWFASYTTFLCGWAALAEARGAEAFSVGVEFASSSSREEAQWRALIANVREVFGGWLTYSANWDEVDRVSFWDALDVIGVNAFQPLAEEPGARFERLLEGARGFADDLEILAAAYGRPVILAEFGFRSMRDSAVRPWEWPEDLPESHCDARDQALAYEAVFRAFAPRRWFLGLFVWKYFANPFDVTQEDPCGGFSPRGKPAERVLRTWFASAEWRAEEN